MTDPDSTPSADEPMTEQPSDDRAAPVAATPEQSADTEEQPPAPPPEITGLIYTRNDRAIIRPAIEGLVQALTEHASSHEIIVVDDASTDGTAAAAQEAAEALGAEGPENVPVMVLRHEAGPGYGSALREALCHARFPLVLQADARCPVAAAPLEAFLAEMDECDLVIGHRRRWAVGVRRRLDDWAYWLLCRVLFGIPLRDINVPLKLYRRDVFDRIRIQSDGWFTDAEVLAKAGFFGMMLGEVPLDWLAPGDGSSQSWRPERFERLLTRQTLREAWRVFHRPDLLPKAADGPLPGADSDASTELVPFEREGRERNPGETDS